VSALAAQLPDSTSLLPIVENAQGLWNALEIARCPRVERLAFGHLDFQHDVGIDGEIEELLYARSHLVLVSRLAGVAPPLDGITAALDDTEKLRGDVERARRLGFGGKLCIHPRQVEWVNRGFLPSARDIEWARRVLAAAEAAGGGAVRMGAEMVDAPVVARAQQILRLSEAAETLPGANKAASGADPGAGVSRKT
jgi:citrate lyase subunit beta/citryl-CoA lyase